MAAGLTTQHERKMLDFLTTDDHSDALNASLSHHLEGTDAWFFESPEFTTWISEEESPILQCLGGPGTGKTVFAGQVIRWLQEHQRDDDAVLYLFCRYSEKEEQTIDRLVSTLLRQTCRRFTKLLPTIAQMQENAKKTQRPPLRECVAQVKAAYIVIDALDECERSCCKKLLDLVSNLSCRCLTTSRSDPTINASIVNSTYFSITASHCDIISYIQLQMPQLRARVTVSRDLESEILEKVLNASGSM